MVTEIMAIMIIAATSLGKKFLLNLDLLFTFTPPHYNYSKILVRLKKWNSCPILTYFVRISKLLMVNTRICAVIRRQCAYENPNQSPRVCLDEEW